MAKSNAGAIMGTITGKVGNTVIKRRNGKLILAQATLGVSKPPTPAQLAHRAAFVKAIQYALDAMQDPLLQALYAAKAEGADYSAYNLAVADYFIEPVVESVDLSGYRGEPGNPIAILASDNVAVTRVAVRIADERGTVLEEGEAEDVPGAALWVYTATVPAAGVTVTVTATAYDHPGHTGSLSVTQGQTPGGED